MQKNQTVSEMAVDVLARQAGIRATRTGKPFEEALKAVLDTEAGHQLGELRDGSHRDERAQRWQEDLRQERTRQRDEAHSLAQQEQRSRARQKERSRIQLAAWKSFMQTELREMELRKDGQLARLLGEPLPGEPPEALKRLALEDQRQAEQGLVALMRDSEVSYKHVEELTWGDHPARAAANRVRTRWLDQRVDRRLGNEG